MALQISCPSCTRALSLPDEMVGQEVRCPSCATPFTAEAPKAPSPVTAAPPALIPPTARTTGRGPAGDGDEDDYPRPGGSYGDFGGALRGRPHRGTLVLILGIAGLVLSAIGLCPYLALAQFVAFGLSLSAWLMGRKDLAAIKQGDMDPAGKDMTQAGWVCGLIGSIISVLVVLLICGLIVAVNVFSIVAASSSRSGGRY